MKNENKMWAILLQFGSNMFGKQGGKERYAPHDTYYHDTMYCDRETWRKVTEFLPQCGINTLLIDMGEGVKLDSHPELAVPGSWEKEEFKEELIRLREMGITPLPKYNFSCTHNAWMQEYAYMVGTKAYEQMCKDVVAEAIELFDYPELFHLGLEEEREKFQMTFPVRVIRSPEKRTEDANMLFRACRDKGVRPWMWADPGTIEAFGGDEGFEKGIPKDVLISNWYYEGIYPGRENKYVDVYHKLEKWGYEQVPTCSTIYNPFNSGQTMHYCRDMIKESDIRGYMTAPWVFTRPEWYYTILSDAWVFANAKKQFYPEEIR